MAIWLPQMGGGKKIKDATALPEDVANGKIFYNNKGRQTGSGKIIQEKSIVITKTNSSYDSITVTGTIIQWISGVRKSVYSMDQSMRDYNQTIKLCDTSTKSILLCKVIVNRKTYSSPIMIDSELGVIGYEIRDSNNYSALELFIYNNILYVYFSSSNTVYHSFTLYYMEV